MRKGLEKGAGKRERGQEGRWKKSVRKEVFRPRQSYLSPVMMKDVFLASFQPRSRPRVQKYPNVLIGNDDGEGIRCYEMWDRYLGRSSWLAHLSDIFFLALINGDTKVKM